MTDQYDDPEFIREVDKMLAMKTEPRPGHKYATMAVKALELNVPGVNRKMTRQEFFYCLEEIFSIAIEQSRREAILECLKAAEREDDYDGWSEATGRIRALLEKK